VTPAAPGTTPATPAATTSTSIWSNTAVKYSVIGGAALVGVGIVGLAVHKAMKRHKARRSSR
jgi:hypothetical protein